MLRAFDSLINDAYEKYDDTFHSMKFSSIHRRIKESIEDYVEDGKRFKRAVALSLRDHRHLFDDLLDTDETRDSENDVSEESSVENDDDADNDNDETIDSESEMTGESSDELDGEDDENMRETIDPETEASGYTSTEDGDIWD